MYVLIGSYLLLVLVLPLVLSGIVSYRAMPVGPDCPHCGGETLRLRSERLRWINAINPFAPIHLRWCLCCAWEGLVRAPDRRPNPAVEQAPPTLTRRTTQTLDVGALDVDGAPWRVMLQCWNGTGRFYGRFVFVAPSGKLWLDTVEVFSAVSEREVLGQALALPEGLLANRLRRLVTTEP
ncbi:hypothetical protein BH23GEM9_BH23GEM9_02220 [soil metagenome]